MQGSKTEMQNTDSTMEYTEEMMKQRKCVPWKEGRCQAEEKSSESKETRGGRGGKREGERERPRKETEFPSSFATPPCLPEELGSLGRDGLC